MLLWVAILYTLALGALSVGAAAFTPAMERRIRHAAPSPPTQRLGTATGLQTAMRFCLYSLPSWVLGAVVAVWLSYVSESGAGYALGLAPFAVAALPAVLWQCIAHDASPAVRANDRPDPQPVIPATR